MKPFIWQLIVIPLPVPKAEREAAQEVPGMRVVYDEVSFAEAAGDMPPVVRQMIADMLDIDESSVDDYVGPTKAPQQAQGEWKITWSTEDNGLMRALVLDVGPFVPELEQGDIVWFPAYQSSGWGGRSDTGIPLDDHRVLINGQIVVGYEKAINQGGM